MLTFDVSRLEDAFSSSRCHRRPKTLPLDKVTLRKKMLRLVMLGELGEVQANYHLKSHIPPIFLHKVRSD